MTARCILLLAATFLLACIDDTDPTDHASTYPPRVDQEVDATIPLDSIIETSVYSGIPPIRLPEDEKPHNAPVEWWYYTGYLQAYNGDRFGFELVIFQAMLNNVPLYVGHFAVADLKRQHFVLSSEATAGAQQQPAAGFSLKAGKLQMVGHDGNDHLIASIDEGPGYALDLQLVSEKPPVLQYTDGIMKVGSDEPFYYYSYTRMKTTGELTVGGKKLAVTGSTWMDHQWGDMGDDFDGWDWYSLRLADNTELMFFVVKRSEGNFVGGTYIAADGTPEALYDGDFTITPTGEWKSPHTDATYPHGWTIQVPSLQLDVEVDPYLEDQEFYEQLFGQPPVYWEGLGKVTGTKEGKPIAGHSYVELTGYADKPNLP